MSTLWDLATLPYAVVCEIIFAPDKVVAVVLSPITRQFGE